MKQVFNTLVFFAVVYFFISGLVSLLNQRSTENATCTDQVKTINFRNDRIHQRYWELNDHSRSFCTSYESSESLSLKVGRQRNEMIISLDRYEDFWGTVYANLVLESKSYIDFLVDSLSTISNENQLDRVKLAELIVTFVQDIPYSYVIQGDCSDKRFADAPCIGKIALGLLSPYEFLHSLYGDCDTRAVLIYTLLEELGFDPMIVVSNEYGHAMLALNLPSVGDHLEFRGKNYYFWETTATGWPLGMLPPNANNVAYWKVALVNES